MNEKSTNNSKNNIGPNSDPWGTPEVTGGGFECDPLTGSDFSERHLSNPHISL